MNMSKEETSTSFEIVEETRHFFSIEGRLKDAEKYGGRPYEYREQQATMALKVAEAFQEKKNLCIEAPTGVGKSFAYLVPAILNGINNKHMSLISTETINLQEQLVEKDLPLLQALMGLDFTFSLAKGRANYLCQRRFLLATGEYAKEYLPGNVSLRDVEDLRHWAATTEDGSRADLDFIIDPQLWSTVCCEAGNCKGVKCRFFRSGCFYWNARREWEKSDVVVANHALFFTDLQMIMSDEIESSLLPPYSSVVIDEAHTIEENAATHLGIKIRSGTLTYLLNRLFNPESGKGILLRGGQFAAELREEVVRLHKSVTLFFQSIEMTLPKNESILRVRKPLPVTDVLSQPLQRLAQRLSEYILEEESDDDFLVELKAQATRCQAIAQELHDFMGMHLENYVYWIEREFTQRGQKVLVLMASPLDIPALLRKMLFDASIPVVLTSATLTVQGSLSYYRQRVGFLGGDELVLSSPFNYEQQVKLYLSRQIPEPNQEGYEETIIRYIEHLITLTHGKAFVLFTSYKMLEMCAEALAPTFDEKGLNLLVQGGELSRSAMLEVFKHDTNSIILGTTSFWTGVDVPGEALSNVIIPKLPFAVPTHPLIQARCEWVEQKGGRSFMDYSLPEAVLKFRQGVGRLIRSNSDTGIVAILDKRVISKRYGSMFLNSIPKVTIELLNL